MNCQTPSQASPSPLQTLSRRRRLVQIGTAAAAALLALSLAGCGGSEDEEAPTVSLVSTVTSAQAGETITLIASASSDLGISAVQLYRVDASTNTLLGSLNATPYQFSATLPSDASGSVLFFSRAVDGDGNTADSANVSITVTD